MTDSANLKLPLLASGQAQKEVTHNEALNVLDALCQLSVLDKDAAAPPGSPAEGDAYIVASSATGDWLAQDGKIAAYYNGWIFRAAEEGWLAYVRDENTFYRYSGSAWAPIADDVLGGLSSPGLVTRMGVGTFTARTLTGTANEITATNGNGVSGNPTLSLPGALTFTGKTVTGGTFSGITLSGTTSFPNGGQITSGGDIDLADGRTIPSTNGGVYIDRTGRNTDITMLGRTAGIPGAWAGVRVQQTSNIDCFSANIDTGGTGLMYSGRDNTGAGIYAVTSAGLVRTPAGTLAAAAYGRFSDDNTGIYFPATDVVGAVAGGFDVMRFSAAASSVNYFSAVASAAGNTLDLAAAGSDPNIDIKITPKGTGLLRYGAYSAITTEVLAGFITLKTTDGTTRKVAIVA